MARLSREWRSIAGWLTIPLASLCLMAQVGTATHFVLVRHRICPEHGEIVDAARDHGIVREVPETTTSFVRAPSEQWGPHGHDHCLLALERREELRPAATPEVVSQAPEVRAEPPAGAQAALPPAIALYLLAPKSSPPA